MRGLGPDLLYEIGARSVFVGLHRLHESQALLRFQEFPIVGPLGFGDPLFQGRDRIVVAKDAPSGDGVLVDLGLAFQGLITLPDDIVVKEGLRGGPHGPRLIDPVLVVASEIREYLSFDLGFAFADGSIVI